MYKGPFVFLFIFIFAIQLLGQQPVLKFRVDSVKTGQPVEAIFYYKHKSNQEILFPDSNYNYAPFELIDKKYFPTRTENGISTDSAIYTLSLFEIEGTHTFALPVIMYSGKDTIKNFSLKDSLTIIPLVTTVSDTLKLKSNTQPLALEENTNFLIMMVVVGIILVLAILIYLLFGRKIKQLIRRYYVKLTHKRFLATFDSMIHSLNTPQKMEETVSYWKKYLDKLEGKPYTTYTSSEIAMNLQRESIKKNLQNIDIAIYGGRSAEVTTQDFMVLRELAIELYHKKQLEKQ